MKVKLMTALAVCGLAVALSSVALAADKEVTVTGDGACGKCVLKETKECQHTITLDEGGKKVTYYLVQNKVDKEFGNQLCEKGKKVTATGTVAVVDGKMELTPIKIALAKD